MKIWRIVSGILSIMAFFAIVFQSCAVFISPLFDDAPVDENGIAVFFASYIILAAGIVSTAVCKSKSRGADISLFILFGIAALWSFFTIEDSSSLIIWAWWSAICSFVSFVTMWIPRKDKTEQVTK